MSNPRYFCEDPWSSWTNVWGRRGALPSWSASIPCWLWRTWMRSQTRQEPFKQTHLVMLWCEATLKLVDLAVLDLWLDLLILEFQPRGFYESTSLLAQAEMIVVTGLGATLGANCTEVQRPPRHGWSTAEGPPEYRHLPFQILWQWHILQLLLSVNSQLIVPVIYNSSVNSCFCICATAQQAGIRCSLAKVCASSISGCCLATAGNGEFSQRGLKLYTKI